MTDYYAILQVSETATEAEIRRAYRNLALKWHPDKNPGNEHQANTKFKELSNAYEILGNPTTRRQYDAERAGNGRSGGTSFGFPEGGQEFTTTYAFRNPEEIFKDFFKGFGLRVNFGSGGGLRVNFRSGGGMPSRFTFTSSNEFLQAPFTSYTYDNRPLSPMPTMTRIPPIPPIPPMPPMPTMTRMPPMPPTPAKRASYSTYSSSSISTVIRNGRKLTKKVTVNNGVQVTQVYENDRLVSTTTRNI